MNVEEAAVERILADSAVQALIGTDIGADPSGGPYENGWVFRKTNDEFTAEPRDVEGTGKASIVVGLADPWTTPNLYNTARFPSLYIVIYADASRVGNGSSLVPVSLDASDRCRRIYDAIDPLFHDAGNRVHFWDDVLITSCVRQRDLIIRDVLNGDGEVRGLATYSLSL